MPVTGFRDTFSLDEESARAAAEIADILQKRDAASLRIETASGKTVDLGPDLAAALGDVLASLHAGAVTIASLPDQLSTSMAADLLGISRPALVKLVEAGAVAAHGQGPRTRLRTADVLRYREQREALREAAFRELREIDVETAGRD